MIGCLCLKDHNPSPAPHLDNIMKNWSFPENLITKQFLTAIELKEILGISVASVYRLIDTRKLPAFKIGGSIRFLKDDVISFLKSTRIDQLE